MRITVKEFLRDDSRKVVVLPIGEKPSYPYLFLKRNSGRDYYFV